MSTEVTKFLAQLSHPFKTEVEELRKIILSADNKITEQVKWNAPSFCIDGDDRITFRLQPPKYIQLIFHRGAKVRKDTKKFSFDDPGGFISWITPDRGTVNFKDMKEIKERSKEFKTLVNAWMMATKV